MIVKVTVICYLTPYSLVKSTEISECLAVCMVRVDLQNVGSSEAPIQLYHTTRRHVQVQRDLHLVGRSRLPSACEKLLGMNSVSVYLSIFLDLFLSLCFSFYLHWRWEQYAFSKALYSRIRWSTVWRRRHVWNVSAAKIPRIVFAYQSWNFINFRLLAVHLPYWWPNLMWSPMCVVQKQELFLGPFK